MEETCEDSTLKNLVIMTHQYGEDYPAAEARLQMDISVGFIPAAVRRGAKIYRCNGASKPDLGALRIILGRGSVIPEAQQEPINKGSESEQTAVRPVEPSKDKEVEELRWELEDQKKLFKKQIAEMQSKEESTRKEMVREHYQELEEQQRSAQQEADGLRKCITEMQSKLEEDRHGSGKTSATHDFRHVPVRSRVFLVGSLTHLALQRAYPSTDLHQNSPIGSTTHFTARNMNNGYKTFRRMTSSGLLTIWIRRVTMLLFLT